MVRELTHFIGGKHTSGTSGGFGDDLRQHRPGAGPGSAGRPGRDRGGDRRRRRGPARVGRVEPAAPRPCAAALPPAGGEGEGLPGPAALSPSTARPWPTRTATSHAVSTWWSSRPVSPPPEGRVQRQRGRRDRRPLAAPAARGGRGHHPFNFPAMIPAVEGRTRSGLRERLHSQASERDPSVPLRLAELFLEAGLPPGSSMSSTAARKPWTPCWRTRASRRSASSARRRSPRTSTPPPPPTASGPSASAGRRTT